MTLEQGTIVALATAILTGLIWAVRQSGRIDMVEKIHMNDIDRLRDSHRSSIHRVDQRVEACEREAVVQASSISAVDNRTRIIDAKLNRIMGHLRVPHRADDLDLEQT